MENRSHDLVETFSGIRGIFGKGINPDLAYKYALSYCQLFKNKNSTLVIGSDSRTSTPVLKKATIKAFSDFNVKKIIDIGVVPVQVCEFSVFKFKASGGVYITASHNEPEYNGWKFLKEDGAILYKEQASRLIKDVHKNKKNRAVRSNSKTKVINKNKEAIDEYIDYVLRKTGKSKVDQIKKSRLKVLADPNGGSSIAILDKLFKKLGVKAEIVNNKLGKFSRLIEPNAMSLAYLAERINEGGFAFGCGFDCDADRVEFVITKSSSFAKKMGQMVSGQYVLALACDTILAGSRNQTVVTNDCTSYLVRDVIKKYNAKMKEVEVGETNVVRDMERQKSIIGGEGSNGGVIIPPIKCRDGIMTTVLILRLISEQSKSLPDILGSYPKYYSERLAKSCSPDQAVKIKKKLEKYFKGEGYKIRKTGGISGGLKIFMDKNSYLWFRSSKTEAGTFRIIADGDEHHKVKQILQKGSEIFNKLIK